MIQNATKGGGFRGVVAYVLREGKEKDHPIIIVDRNMAGDNAQDLAREFGGLRQIRPDLGKAVYHCSLRLPENEHFTTEQWRSFSRDYMEGMGFTDVPYITVDHGDNHVHIVASRIRFDGTVVSDSNDYYRSNDLVWQLEERYQLSHATERPRNHNKAELSREEIGMVERLDEISPKVILAERINEAIKHSDGTRDDFTRQLKNLDVETRWNISATTGRVSGASFHLLDHEGTLVDTLKGSQIGKQFAWTQLNERLQERAREYDHEDARER